MILLGDDAPKRNFGIFSSISRTLLKLLGWKILPAKFNSPKAILVAGPHTSNWDFVYGMLFMMSINIDLKWMGKASIFKKPFVGLLKSMGGIPIERNKNKNAVDQTVEIFSKKEKLCLALSPEGTRSKTTKWKSGFYHIAKGANVPIVTVFLDYKTKSMGFNELFYASDSFEENVDKIKSLWSKCVPKIPDQY